MKRRTFLQTTAGLSGAVGLSGCISGVLGGQDELGGTLRVATYSSFVDAPSSAPGPWLKEQFEAEFEDVTIDYETPDNELNHYLERAGRGVDIDADVYVGLNVDHLIRVDDQLEDPLFEPTADALSNYDGVREDLLFDPEDRAIPYDTGYISLVYDENEVEEPETFDDLTTDAYEGDLIVQNAQSAATGRAFLLWTIHEKSEDGYLDYWRDLADNDVRILGSWDDAYASYSEGEAPMVVSYSTDQVYANEYGEDMSRHQIAFLEDQGYANPEGMAKFADTDQGELAEAFMDFLLRPEVQAEIAVRNVQFPAVADVELDEEFDQFAHAPPQPVTFTYEELAGNVDEWVEDWAREIAGQ